MAEIVLPELSYKIMGILFSVHNELGVGLLEKHYQRAIKRKLIESNIVYAEQVRVDLDKERQIGCYYLDFAIENKIVLEIKAVPRFSRDNIFQVLRYLKATGMELGLLASFYRRDLIYRRILKGFKLL